MTPEERTIRADRSINNEVLRRIQRRDQDNTNIPMTVAGHGAAHDISVAHVMRDGPDFVGPRPDVPDEESEEEDETTNMLPSTQTH